MDISASRAGGLAARVQGWYPTLAALLLLVLCRVLAADLLQPIDALIGRSGDSLLLLGLLLAAAASWLQRRADEPPGMQQPATHGAAALEQHLRLDAEIDKRLNEVVADTERSALAIIEQVRQLYDRAAELVGYLEQTDAQAGAVAGDIADSMAYLVQVGSFIQQLPGKIERDVQAIQRVSHEIQQLSGLAEAVQAISLQSHLLAINAAIEASRAGESGRAFRVVADEVKTLAANSSSAARQINAGLARARKALQEGIEGSIADSSERLEEIAAASACTARLQQNFEEMTGFYRSRFAEVSRHNGELAHRIGEVLGQAQYQDVVRQTVERMQATIARRNLALEEALREATGAVALGRLGMALGTIAEDYLSEEQKHAHSARGTGAEGGAPMIELF